MWSDLFSKAILMPEIELKATVIVRSCVANLLYVLNFSKALVCLVSQGKTNTDGHLDEHAALRHREVHLCCIGGLAILLFVHFHVLGKRPPNFAADFTDLTCGEFGKCSWYDLYLFPTSASDNTEPMTYKSKCFAFYDLTNSFFFRPPCPGKGDAQKEQHLHFTHHSCRLHVHC